MKKQTQRTKHLVYNLQKETKQKDEKINYKLN